MRRKKAYERQHELDQEVIARITQARDELQMDYLALEQGRNEQDESYQQMLLDEYDKYHALVEKVGYLQAIVDEHNAKCLFDLGIKNTP